MRKVYVLNNSYECISQTTVSRAIFKVRNGEAEVVRWTEEMVHTVKEAFRIPLIIRIYKYVRAFGRAMKYSNRFVWERDNYTCQYCGKHITEKSDLETDHVHPQSRGGKTIYENMVTACFDCNQHKADRTPEEAKMFLKKQPGRPLMSRNMAKIADEAKKIIEEMEW